MKVKGTTILAVLFFFAVAAFSAEDDKVGYGKQGLRPLKTAKDMTEMKDATYFAHSCPKCKTITIITRQLGTKAGVGSEDRAVNVHQCPGCEGKLVTKAGSKESAYVHVCKKCGSEEAFCCALNPGDPTPGMEKK